MARRPAAARPHRHHGSRHEWLAGQPPLDLIVTLDDATGAIHSAFPVEEEGTASTFRALEQVFTEHGLPGALHTDRGNRCFHTPEAGGKVDESRRTRVGRALHQRGIKHIAACSPEAGGYSERAFATLQDRLVEELALAGVSTIEDANRFIATPPELDDGAFVPLVRPDRIDDTPCLHEERIVAARVRVHEYPDGALAVFHGPGCLARYQADGTLIETRTRKAA